MKKRIYQLLCLGTLAISVFSCDSFLDINDENPNAPLESTPQQVLPNALTTTAANLASYNDYGAWHVGYLANAGGYGGWGAQLTYNYTTQTYNPGLWASTYDNLTDYDYIEKQTAGNPLLSRFEAIAKIMKAYNFQLLVDTYGDIPYTNALQGVGNLTPTYDKGEDIYKDLVAQINTANTLIDNAPATALAVSANSDVMFAGNMTNWKRFANTVKLRLLVRASKNAANTALPEWVSTGFASMNASTPFLQDDAIVNPGYRSGAGKTNPYWNLYHTNSSSLAAAGAGRSRIPTPYVLTYYNGNRISDPLRVAAVYRSGTNVPVNQLGQEAGTPPTAPSGAPAWYVGTGTADAIGILKGLTAGVPIILASESYFLQAEAIARGFMPGNAKTAFETGISRSFTYLYKGANNQVAATYTPTTYAADYLTTNATNRLVNFDLAGTVQEKVEAIITQKYIALNMIHSHEAWNEYRRTGYPAVSGSAESSTTSTFASRTSILTTPDKLPVRILYPATEEQFNAANAPQGVNVTSSRIFWDVQ